MKQTKALTNEEKLAKKKREIMHERRRKTIKYKKPEKKYDPWMDG